MLRKAIPIIAANAAVPLLGLVDTAVIGHTGRLRDLGAIALGSLVFSFLYWSFGFLRMGTTGFVAQAAGRAEGIEVRAVVGRSLLMGVALGIGLVLLQRPIAWLAFELLSADGELEQVATRYVLVRIWAAPATLGTFALMGALIGLGRSRELLAVQVFLSLLNMALDLWFAGGLGWGAPGIALGTALAEWAAFALSLVLAGAVLRADRNAGEPFWPWARLFDFAALRHTLRANTDILLRTLCLLGGFAWFTNRGAAFGSETLAVNHILLQFVTLSAFFLDGYANVAESLVGMAIGARDLRRFDRALRLSTELAGVTALILAALIVFAGEAGLMLLTDLKAVRGLASAYLPLAALYVFLSFAAFQLDGIFIGATRTRAMRNASALSLALFLLADFGLRATAQTGLEGWAGNRGLWIAFIVYVVTRALTLGAHLPALRAEVEA